jgi:hypothetical protein
MRPDCCTANLVDLLLFTEDLLARHGITHWLDFGTLLGAVRERRLIPWDADVDFGVLDSDLDAILALAAEVEAAGHRLVQDGSLVRINYSAANESHVDLWPWSQKDGSLVSAYSDYDWPGMAGQTTFPRAYLDEPGSVSLYGKRFPTPAPADRFLREHRYGPGYMTPSRSLGYCFRFRFQIGPEELTPAVQEAVDAVAAGDARLCELVKRSPALWPRAWWWWRVSGLPVRPDPSRFEQLRESYAPEEWTPMLERVATALAVVEQAIEELEHPRPALPFRRARRRLVRVAEIAAAARAGRPHRASFPVGEPPSLAARQAADRMGNGRSQSAESTSS